LDWDVEAIEFMADIIPEVRHLYALKTLELAVFLHFDAIDQQLQIRQGQGSLARRG